jgi:hypothetical protein
MRLAWRRGGKQPFAVLQRFVDLRESSMGAQVQAASVARRLIRMSAQSGSAVLQRGH